MKNMPLGGALQIYNNSDKKIHFTEIPKRFVATNLHFELKNLIIIIKNWQHAIDYTLS